MGTSNFSGSGGYQFTIEAALESQDAGRKTSYVYWELIVTRPSGNWWAWATTGMGNRGRVWDGNGSTLWENTNMDFDFRNGNRWVLAKGHKTIQHRADGTAEYNIQGDMNLYIVGSASAGTGRRSLPRLARVPDAPSPLYIDRITTSSLRYVFGGNGDGGTPVREWQALWQEGSGRQNERWANGALTLSSVKPATRYNFWSRGRNDVGWGPWSRVISARTLSGARVKYQGVWREAVPYVKYRGVWRCAESHVRNGGKWKRGI